jgi:hypothetical protein
MDITPGQPDSSPEAEAESEGEDEGDTEEADDNLDSDEQPLERVAGSLDNDSAWEVTFNKELMTATRVKPNQRSTKQVSEPIIDDAKADPISMVRASFAPCGDGFVDLVEVPGLTYQALRALVRTKPASTGKLWSREHSVTHHKVTLEQRVDRKLLLSLYEQSKQRLQVRIDSFGPVLDQSRQLPSTDPVLQKALEFMIPMAQAFVNDEVDLVGLRRMRNDSLAPPAKAKAKATMKRPATGSPDKQADKKAVQEENGGRSVVRRPAAQDSANGGVPSHGVQFDNPPPSASSKLSPMMAEFLR